MAILQLDFFQETEMTVLHARMDKCEKSSDRVRKSLFAKNGDHEKRIKYLEEELDFLKRMICQNKL